ncbi:MAG: hypothetical protein KJ607_07185 [Bacteroidetes bacterium]|nr:hypothetical protein [Bacteroidota bacterium]
MKYITDETNGLRIKKTIGDYVFIAQYKPADFIVLQNDLYEPENDAGLLSEADKLRGFHYIDLRINTTIGNHVLKNGLSDENEYYDRIQYFVSGVQNDITLTEGTDTLICNLCHFEYNDLSPSITLVLGFERKNRDVGNAGMVLTYNDRIFNTGIVKIRFGKDDLNSIPDNISYEK